MYMTSRCRFNLEVVRGVLSSFFVFPLHACLSATLEVLLSSINSMDLNTTEGGYKWDRGSKIDYERFFVHESFAHDNSCKTVIAIVRCMFSGPDIFYYFRYILLLMSERTRYNDIDHLCSGSRMHAYYRHPMLQISAVDQQINVSTHCPHQMI